SGRPPPPGGSPDRSSVSQRSPPPVRTPRRTIGVGVTKQKTLTHVLSVALTAVLAVSVFKAIELATFWPLIACVVATFVLLAAIYQAPVVLRRRWADRHRNPLTYLVATVLRLWDRPLAEFIYLTRCQDDFVRLGAWDRL